MLDKTTSQVERARRRLPIPAGIERQLKPMRIPLGLDSRARRHGKGPAVNPFEADLDKLFPPQARPKGKLATDELVPGFTGISGWAAGAIGSIFSEGMVFPGYAYLAVLAQRTEYRRISEIIATEMTRKWIKLQSVGDADKTDRIKELNDELDRVQLRDKFRHIAELDGYFGRSHLYVDVGTTDDRDELKTNLGNGRNDITKAKLQKGSLQGFRPVEPVWCYPTTYDSINPLKKDWYAPEYWWVMTSEIHKTRLLKFVGREVPDLLKPAYSFGGLSLSQLARPYVDNWLRTRQSVSDLIHSFSVMILKTDLSTLLQGHDGEDVFQRADLFNGLRDNKGIMLLNHDTEDFGNVSVPLGSLDQLQAQSQEQICSATGIPLVKYTGISPHGLNASSEGEIRVFYDWINAFQEKLFRPNLTICIDFCMVNLWGEVDDEITFGFEPLWELDKAAAATVRLTNAQAGQIHMDTGTISQEEERKRIATDPESPYTGIDVNELPEPPEQGPEEGSEGGAPRGGPGGGVSGFEERLEEPGEKEEEEPERDHHETLKSVKEKHSREQAHDEAEFEENKHPRGKGGQFTSGGGNKSSRPFAVVAAGHVKQAKAWLLSGGAKRVLKSVATKHNLKRAAQAALAVGIIALIGHLGQTLTEPHNEERVKQTVEHFAEQAGIAKNQAKSIMQNALGALVKVRSAKAHDEESDAILAALQAAQKLLEGIDGTGEGNGYGQFRDYQDRRAGDGEQGVRGAIEARKGSDKGAFHLQRGGVDGNRSEDGASRRALDEAEFEESKHPRDKDGKFAKYGAYNNIKGPLKDAGFTKAGYTSNNKLKYTHPSGVVAVIEPPTGKLKENKSGVWTIYVPYEGSLKGTIGGVALQKALTSLTQYLDLEGEQKPPAEKQGVKKEPKKQEPKKPSSTEADVLGNMGFESAGSENFWKKGDAQVKYDPATKQWWSKSPGHLDKTGNGLASLKYLIEGKGVIPGVKNEPFPFTPEQLAEKSKAEQAAAKKAEAQKKAAEQAQKKLKEISGGGGVKSVFEYLAVLGAIVKTLPEPTQQQMAAIKAYTNGSYSQMNGNLRLGGSIQEDSKADNLQSYLDSCSLPEDLTVYRGVKGEYALKIRKAFESGQKEFVDKGFMSTTIYAGKMKNQSGESLVLALKMKKGAKAAPINHVSVFQGELEVLVKAGSGFRISSIEKAGGGHVAICELIQS